MDMSHLSDFTSRRQFIQGLGLGAAATLCTAASVASAEQSAPVAGHRSSGHAKNLIFLMVDGWSAGALGLAHHWHLRQQNQPLHWMQLYSHPGVFRAQQDTASASSPVTDSAAAASAWGSGQRVHNGAINMTAQGQALTPILRHARQAGKATGLVTTCRITHATPAGFAANSADRNLETQIAQQYLEHEIDVLLGGGARHFDAKLLADFKASSYALARDTQELKQLAGRPKLLGLFAESHLPYRIDRMHLPEYAQVPGLPQLLQTALQSLQTNPQGFVLQVEAGRVDHACHVNDAAAMLHEFLEYDRCIQIALDYVQAHPDTQLIVTTDHATGGCQLNGLGSGYKESGVALDRIQQFTRSFEWLQDQFVASGRLDPELFQRVTGLALTEDQAGQIQAAIDAPVEYLSSTMTAILQPDLMAQTATSWTSNNHTAECVDFMAVGPGAEQLPPFIRNDDVFRFMCESLQLGT